MVEEHDLGMRVDASAEEERSRGMRGRRQGRSLEKEKDP